MGIFGALNAAVSGLRAQSFALENIAGNIANSQTTAFKRVDTSFADLVGNSVANVRHQTSGTVLAMARATNTVQGAIEASGVKTFMAINGDGYFAVQKKTADFNGQAVFSGNDLYSRRGDFTLDKQGHLVNGAGHYLMGRLVDPATGNAIGGTPEVIQIGNDFLPAEATTEITYRANLPSSPLTNSGDEFLDGGLIGGDILEADETTFFDTTISGGAITTYDANGSPVNVQMRWAKTTDTPDTWNLYYMSDSDPADPLVDPKWTLATTGGSAIDFEFDPDGSLSSPAGTNVVIDTLTVNGNNLGDITFNYGAGGLTQFDDPSGVAQITSFDQDGNAPGELIDIAISDSGRIVGHYTNGKAIEIAEVPLFFFNADSSLKRVDGSAFMATQESGIPIIGANGLIVGGALEASNTDIADEFSKLIVTQQAYSANTRIISTSDEMLQEALAMVR